jgi:predicted DNA-binding protein (MmcQ/YjbR family)
MNIQAYRMYCLSKAGTSEATPFDVSTLVFKVGEKIFAICNIDSFEFINLKCDPERAIELRERYDFIRPGWHMNKQHWNSVHLHEGITDDLLSELIDHSYELILSSLSKKLQAEIRTLD